MPDKATMLRQLTQATKAQLPDRASAVARSRHKEAGQLALDLIFYGWASARSTLPTDVANIDLIIPELARALDDPVVDWAIEMFPRTTEVGGPVTLPPWDDERVSLLSDLRREYGVALDYQRSMPVEAVNALSSALIICQKLQLDISEALVRKELGDHYLYTMSRYKEADLCYNTAALIFSPYDCIESSAVVYDDYGFLKARLGQVSAAVTNYERAAQQWLKLADSPPGGSRYRKAAGEEYIKAGVAQATADPEKALDLMNRGLDHLWNHAYASKSFADFVTNAISVAEIHRDRGNSARCLDLLGKAKSACSEEGDPLLSARLYGELAKSYKSAGNVGNAAEATRKRGEYLEEAARVGEAALSKLEAAGSLSQQAQARYRRDAERGAVAYRELGQYDKSARAWRGLAQVNEKADRIEDRANCLRSLAAVLDLQKKPKEALEARLEAAVSVNSTNKTLARDIGFEMVQALVAAGDLPNALEAFRDLVPIFEESGDVRGAAGILEGRGTLLANTGNYEDAITDFRDARTVYLDQVGDPWEAGSVSLKLAAAQVGAERPDEARETLDAALEQIEKNYAESLDPNADPKRGELLMNLYQRLASLYVTSGRDEDATALLKKARRYPWISELAAAMRNDRDPLVQQFAVTRLDDIFGGSSQSYNPHDLPSNGRLWADTWSGYWNTCVSLRAQHPAAYNSLPIDPLELLKNSRQIPKDSVVITYMLAGSSTYAFLCGYDEWVCREVGGGSGSIGAQVSLLRRALKNCEESLSVGMPIPPVNDWQGPSFLEIKGPLVEAYALLIQPIRQDISQRRLIFVLPGDLNGVPMHALISSDAGRTPRFLVQDYEVSYLSDGMLNDLVGRDSRIIDSSSDRLAIFADPEGNLPGARTEASAIRNVYFNSQWYLGERATVSNLLKECQRSGILHIAAHHWIDPNPSKFELQLAPDEQSDGVVGIDQLSALTNSRIGLVVLSACDSVASSDPISSGPSRAAEMFSTVGVKSLLGGLWKVSDEAAAKLMGDFYRNLSRGQSRTEALQRAQVLMIESSKFAHPFYWACFALYGNPR